MQTLWGQMKRQIKKKHNKKSCKVEWKHITIAWGANGGTQHKKENIKYKNPQ